MRLRTETLQTFDKDDTAAAALDEARSKRPAPKRKRAPRGVKE